MTNHPSYPESATPLSARPGLDEEALGRPSTSASPPGPAEKGSADAARPLSRRRLESHLWAAANLLRGKIDSADFKSYILGLLFYKRLCDVWEEECAARQGPCEDPAAGAEPRRHRFQVPAVALWRNVCDDRPGIGRRLNAALRAIEEANPRLAGVFQEVSFDHGDRFPDSTLEILLRHFEIYRLRHSDVEPDMLGNVYEYLIAQFADDSGKRGGEFYTPKQVVRILVECLDPQPGMSIYDPACGSGGMLLGAVAHVERQGRGARTLELCGQEMNVNTWGICQTNLLLHGIDRASVVRGDTLRRPKHLEPCGQRLRTFDRVLANPPFSLKNWGWEAWCHGDAFGRDRYGCPTRAYGDLAFLQHMIASLAPHGMLGVVAPLGILFRRGSEQRIRRSLIEDDLIEAVIGLGPNLFYGTTVSACILVLARRKARRRRGKVLFIDGGEEFEKRKKQNRLTDANVARLVGAFHGFRDAEGLARVVTLPEIASNDYHLTISRYVRRPVVDDNGDAASEFQALRQLRAERDAAEARMLNLLQELGLDE